MSSWVLSLSHSLAGMLNFNCRPINVTTCSIGLAWVSQSGSTESAAHHSEHWIKQSKCWWLICQRINLFQPPWRLRPHVSRWAHDKTDKSRGTSGFHIARIYRPVGRSQGVQSTEESVLIFACLFLFLVDWAASNQSSKLSEQRWEGRKLRLEDEQWLTLCCSLRGDYRWDCLARLCSLSSSSLTHSAKWRVCDSQVHHPCLCKRGKGQRYASTSSYFTLGPAPSFFFSFLTENLMPYLGEGRGGKGSHVTGGFGVVSEKNSLNFSNHHRRMRGDWEGRREWWLNPQHTAVGESELQRALRNKQEIRYLYLNRVFHFFPPQNLKRWAVDTKSPERKADKRVVTHPLVYSNTWKWLWLQIKGTGNPPLYIQSQREVLLPEASQDRENERKDGNHDITDELRVDLWACGVINRAHQSSMCRCFVNTDQAGELGGVSADTPCMCASLHLCKGRHIGDVSQDTY